MKKGKGRGERRRLRWRDRETKREAEEITAQETRNSFPCPHERILLGFLKPWLSLDLVLSCLCSSHHNVGEGRAGCLLYVPIYRVLPRYPVPSGSGLSVEETPTEGRACIWKVAGACFLSLFWCLSFKCSDMLLPELYLMRTPGH